MEKKTTLKRKKVDSYNQPKKSRLILEITAYTFILLTFFISLILYANYIYFHNRFFLQTKVGGHYIGGMTLAEAQRVLKGAINDFHQDKIEIQINNKVQEIAVSDFDSQIEAQEILENIYRDQHPSYPDTFSQFIYSIKSNFAKYHRNFNVDLKEQGILHTIYTNFDNISPLKEPEIIHKDGNFIVVEGSSGSKITHESISYIKEGFSYLYSGTYNLNIEKSEPKLSYGEVSIIADAANGILEKELKLSAGDINVTEKLSEHPEWILFDISTKTYANALFSQPVYYKFGNGVVAGEEELPVSFSILLNPEEIENYVNNTVVNQIENHAENIYLRLDANEEITVTGQLRDGYALEKEEAVRLIVDNFKQGIYQTELPISVQKGKIFDETGLNLGIEELIGFGESDFSHSDANRENNIKVGLSRFQNVIISPGEVFNYANYIGPIDAAHGFLPGWVIKNRTQNVLEYGGGICQTSTTLFRAAFYGGFPILERHPHSYDVKYYRWPQPGLDASVYVPYSSLKFKNDSPGHILIQQEVDLNTKRAKVWIYGTDDSRKVEVSGPTIYGKYWASNSYEVPSENLAPGQRVLSHGAVAGFQSDWYRTVTYTDGREENYNVHSSYSAVPATYLVGVGE